jgi:hypothetical protein
MSRTTNRLLLSCLTLTLCICLCLSLASIALAGSLLLR